MRHAEKWAPWQRLKRNDRASWRNRSGYAARGRRDERGSAWHCAALGLPAAQQGSFPPRQTPRSMRDGLGAGYMRFLAARPWKIQRPTAICSCAARSNGSTGNSRRKRALARRRNFRRLPPWSSHGREATIFSYRDAANVRSQIKSRMGPSDGSKALTMTRLTRRASPISKTDKNAFPHFLTPEV